MTRDERRSLRRGHREGGIIAALAFAGMSASFTQTLLIPIQADLPDLLDASRDDTAWVITVTLLVSAICTPISGKLGDMYGKRRVAVVLLSLLAAGSLLSALAPGMGLLILGRGLQGAGMGAIPLGISILRDVLHQQRLGSAVALVSATLGVGGALGLPASALVVRYFEWHAVFVLSTVLGIVSLVLVLALVPASTLRTGGRLDVVGAIGLAIGLTGVLLAISRGNDWGWTSAPTLGLLVGGLVVLLAWGVFELRTSNPLVDLRVSARAPVLLTNLASIAMGFALFGSNIVFPQLLELPAAEGGLGLDILNASLVMMPAGLAMLAMSPVAGRIARRSGPKPLFFAGGAVIALAYAISVALELDVALILVINVAIGVGIGLGYAAMPTLIMQAVPAHETGAANGLNTLMRSLGTSTAAAVVASVLAGGGGEGAEPSGPSTAGFTTALVLCLVAAVICAVVAAFIPRPRPHTGEHPSIPEGTITPSHEVTRG